MSDVSWIKITTDMFDNRKIKHLRRLPSGNDIVLIWVMLLTMAGRCNAGGMIFLTENIPYTSKMIADELDFEENTVQLALKALEQLGMISTDKGLLISNWQEYQNENRLSEIREQNKLRKQKQREREKLVLESRDSHVTVTPQLCDSHAIEEDKEKENKNKSKKDVKHKHGEYARVMLTDSEYQKLVDEYGEDTVKQAITKLDGYKEQTGKVYKSDYAAMRNWVFDSLTRDTKKPTYNRPCKDVAEQFSKYDMTLVDVNALADLI